MFDRGLLRIAGASLARPRRALAAMILLTLAAAPGLLRLEIRTDGHALMPPDHPVVRFDAEVREHFQLRDPIVVLIETSHPDGIYNLETLRKLQELSDALAALPGIGRDHVLSLATERRDRVFPGTLSFRPFLSPLPTTPVLMSLLRSDVAAVDILQGTLVSADSKAAAILVGAPPAFDGDLHTGTRTGADRTALYRDILRLARPYQGGEDRISVAGAPVAESLLGSHILEDLALLVPLAILVLSIACWWGCRRISALLLVLPKMAACLVWTFGVMGWLGVPVHLTTAVLPVILVTAGLSDEIHLLWRYQRVLARAASPRLEAVRQTFEDLARPLALTSLTTAAGFLSFVASSIAPVRFFGLFAGLGILFCLLWTFSAVPATMALLSPERLRRSSAGAADASDAVAGGWATALFSPLLSGPRARRATLAALLLVTVALGLGLGRLQVQDSWIDGFAPGSPFRRATDRINAQLHGSHTLLAHLAFAPPQERIPGVRGRNGPLLDPAMLRATGDFEAFLRSRPGVGGVLGPHSQFTTVSYLWLGRREEARSVPDEPRKIEQLFRLFDRARGEFRRRQVVDDDLRRGVVSIFLKEANYRETAALMDAIRAYERERLAPLGIRVDFAGDVAVSQAMIPEIVRTQISSLLLALAGCWIVIALLHRSLALGSWAALPAWVAVVWLFGTMGWFGIPLGVATSMFCAITLGIGVDYAIHYLERYHQARAAGGASPARQALAEAGPSIVVDCLAIALGFGLLAVSQVPANARLGILVAMALGACCLLTLAGLGALLPAVARKPAAAAAPEGFGTPAET